MAGVREQQAPIKEVGLRPYRSHDLDAMYALDVVCFDQPFRFTRRAMRRFAEAANALVIIAEEADAVVGFVILHVEEAEEERTGYIITLDVAPDCRRRGIASLLMREAERKARLNGCTALMLHVFSGNTSAVSFYARLGFAQVSRARHFYGPQVDAWVYRKPLSR